MAINRNGGEQTNPAPVVHFQPQGQQTLQGPSAAPGPLQSAPERTIIAPPIGVQGNGPQYAPPQGQGDVQPQTPNAFPAYNGPDPFQYQPPQSMYQYGMSDAPTRFGGADFPDVPYTYDYSDYGQPDAPYVFNFDNYGWVSGEVLPKADEAVSRLRAAYAALSHKVGADSMIPGSLLDFVLAPITDNYQTDKQVAKSVHDVGLNIERWATVIRGWAEKGKRDDGSTFTWNEWADMGDAYSKIVRGMGQDFDDAGLWNSVQQTMKQTGKQVAAAIPEPSSLGAGMVLAGLLIGGGIIYSKLK